MPASKQKQSKGAKERSAPHLVKPEDRKHGGGNRRVKFSDEQIRAIKLMYSGGIQLAEIAKWLKVGVRTLERYFRKELDAAKLEVEATVVGRLFKATEHDQRAREYWLNNQSRGRWTHTQKVDINAKVEHTLEDLIDESYRLGAKRSGKTSKE